MTLIPALLLISLVKMNRLKPRTTKSYMGIQWNSWTQACLGLMALAIFLFSFRLGYQSFWMDELFSGYWANKQSLSDSISRSILYDVHPPFHTIYLYFWIKFFGNSEIAIRASSVIFAVSTIAIMLWYMPKIFSKRITVISCLLLITAPTTIYYAQNARYNILLLFFGVVLTLQFIDFVLRSKNNQPIHHNKILVFTFVSLAMTFTHYLGTLTAYILFTSIILLRLILRQSIKDFLIGFVILISPTALWFAYVYFGVMPWLTGGHWLGKPNEVVASGLALLAFNPIQWIVVLCMTPLAAIIWQRLSPPAMLKVTGPTIISIPLLGSFVWRSQKNRLNLKERFYSLSNNQLSILCCLFIIGSVLTAAYIFSIVISPIMLPRGFTMILPAVFILVAIYLDLIAQKMPKTAWGFIIILLLLNLPQQWTYYYTIHKEQWRNVSQKIADLNKTSTQPLALILISGFPQIEYYLDKMIPADKMPAIYHVHHLFEVASLKNEKAFVNKRIVLVLTDPHWTIWDRQYFYFYYADNYSGAPMFRNIITKMLNLPSPERVDYYTDIQVLTYPENSSK